MRPTISRVIDYVNDPNPALAIASTVSRVPGSTFGNFTDTPRHFRWNRWALFAQDDWKVTSRLTLNLGLRWEVFANPTETNGLLSNIILGSGSSLAQQISSATVGRVKQLWKTRYGNVAPRIGLYARFGGLDGNCAATERQLSDRSPV